MLTWVEHAQIILPFQKQQRPVAYLDRLEIPGVRTCREHQQYGSYQPRDAVKSFVGHFLPLRSPSLLLCVG